MKKIITLIFALTMLAGCTEAADNSTSVSSADANVAASTTLSPVWTLTDINGTSHSFPESAEGKTTIVLFWATWCPYCKRLMPHLQSILYQYGETLNLQILALTIFDEDGDPVKYIEENGFDFLVFKDADKVARLYEIKGTPGLLIVDAKGQIRFDLRNVQTKHLKAPGSKHWQKAIKTAPYWGAEIRKALELLE